MTSGAPGSPHSYVPIKLRIAPEPKIIYRRKQNADDLPPAHLLDSTPRAPSHRLPPMAPVANHVVNVMSASHVRPEDLDGLEVGDTLVYGSGTLREITEIGGDGAITVKTTKIWPADKLNHQFCFEPGLDGFCSHDYLSLQAEVVLYPTFKVAEGNGNQFTIVEVQETGNIVTGVVFSFSQVFPKGFAADLVNIVDIVKREL